jgi:hypothetical protein
MVVAFTSLLWSNANALTGNDKQIASKITARQIVMALISPKCRLLVSRFNKRKLMNEAEAD